MARNDWRTWMTAEQLAARVGLHVDDLRTRFRGAACPRGECRYPPEQVELIEQAVREEAVREFRGKPGEIIGQLVSMLKDANRANQDLLKNITEPQQKLNTYWERALERERIIAETLWKTHAEALGMREQSLTEAAERAREIIAAEKKDERLDRLLAPIAASSPVLVAALAELMDRLSKKFGLDASALVEEPEQQSNGQDYGEPLEAEGEAVEVEHAATTDQS